MPEIPFWIGVGLVSLLALWLVRRLFHRRRKRYASDRQWWWMD